MNKRLTLCLVCHNSECFIEEALTSLLKQSEKDVEFIIVNDGSSDKTAEICKKFLRDTRFKYFEFFENRGTYIARSKALEEAQGEYIGFLDSDDLLASSRSLTLLNDIVSRHKTDVVQFNVSCFGQNPGLVESFQHLFQVRGKVFVETPGQILKKIFKEKEAGFTLWNKLYRKEVIQRALNSLIKINEKLPSGEDALLAFQILYYANTYQYVDSEPIIRYRVGSGISTKSVSFKNFENYKKELLIPSYIVKFLDSRHAPIEYYEYVDALQKDLARTLIYRFKALKEDQKKQTSSFIFEYKEQSVAIIEALQEIYKNHEIELLNSLNFREKKCNTKILGIYYPRYYDGGVERVISLQLPKFLDYGIEVFLITDEEEKEKEYFTPIGVKRVVLGKTLSSLKKRQRLKECIDEYKIDTLLYHHASSDSSVLFDLLFLKMLGVKLIVQRHEVTGAILWNDLSSRLVKNTFLLGKIYEQVDILVLLSRLEASFFQLFATRIAVIPNPPTYPLDSAIGDINNRKYDVVWVGRLSSKEKQYQKALDIIALVSKSLKGFRGLFIASPFDPGSQEYLNNYIKQHKLENNLEWIERTNEIDSYLKNSKIALITSRYESFSFSTLEAKIFGLPIVCFEIPGLELLEDSKGALQFAQGDTINAAEAIIKLLNDPHRLAKFSIESKKSSFSFYAGTEGQENWKILFTQNPYFKNYSSEEYLGKFVKNLSNNILNDNNIFDYANDFEVQKKIRRYDKLESKFSILFPRNSIRRAYAVKITKRIWGLLKK